MSGTGWMAGLPSRRIVIGSFVGALASGGLFGLVLGVLAPAGPGMGKTLTSATLPSGPASPTSAVAAGQAAAAIPSATRKATLSTTTLAGGAVPQDYVKHPERDGTMFLGTINALDSGNPQHVVIWLKPAELVQGARALFYNATHGQQARNTAVIPLDGAQAQSMTLQNDAAFWGLTTLAGQQDKQRLAFSQFVNNVNQVLAQDQHPGVWVKRSATGTVIYLAEAKIS